MKPSVSHGPPTGTRPHRSGAHAATVWVYTAFLACSLLAVFLATSARPTSAQKAAQAAVFAAIFLTALPVLLSLRQRRVTVLTLATYGVMALFAAPAVTQKYFDLEWFIGDILLLSVPVLLGIGIYGCLAHDGDLLRRCFRAAVACLAAAAIVGSFFPDPYDNFRFAPPAPLLMAAVCVGLFALRGTALLATTAGFGLLAVLTWQSQWRSSGAVLLFISGVSLYYLLRGPARVLLAHVAAILVALLLVFGPGLMQNAESGESNNRILKTFEEGGLANDSSTMFRFVEADAVLRTAQDEWSSPNLLIGAGHGGTYNLAYLATLPGSSRFEERNGSDGRVHNIHLGALLLAYRYGIVGALASALIVLRVVLMVTRTGRDGLSMKFAVALAFVGCALLHLANNVTTQIHFSLTAALLVAICARDRWPHPDHGVALSGIRSGQSRKPGFD